MTTEIAIMNKSAIAMAADSAVTITVTGAHGNGSKILNSANKLFSLSKCAPIGLMIHGNASMLGIPWETIVKMYREHLGDKEFPVLKGYCDDFFGFLDRFDISSKLQERYVVNGAAGLFHDLRKQLDKWVQERTQSGKQVTQDQVKAKLGRLIKTSYEEFLRLGDQSVLSKTKRSSLRKVYGSTVLEVAKQVFEKIPLSRQMESRLLTIAVGAASIGPLNQSGVVIAGFGTRELYPHWRSYDVAAVFAGKTIKRDGKAQAITDDMKAVITSFAQSDDVQTFMEGIGPLLLKFLKNTFYGIMTNGLPNHLRDEISAKLGLTDQQKKELRKITGDMCKGTCDAAFKQLADQQRVNYIEPVVKATEFLNKSELAAMAETLVNLVSFRKQVTMEAETVGGPVDVAVITKGDGLVWIKRKHYFPPELNHHFFSNYYRKVGTHGQD